jgi:hypothetical protein
MPSISLPSGTIGREESLPREIPGRKGLNPVYRIERKQGKKGLLQMKRSEMKEVAIPRILCTVWRFPSRTPRDEDAGFSVPNVILEKVLIYPNDLLFNLLLAIIWIRKDNTWTRTRRVLGPLRPTRRLLGN